MPVLVSLEPLSQIIDRPKIKQCFPQRFKLSQRESCDCRSNISRNRAKLSIEESENQHPSSASEFAANLSDRRSTQNPATLLPTIRVESAREL
jgi:hypothetical protein